jgi:3-oxoacyl-[acyl-carrier protein] reductase
MLVSREAVKVMQRQRYGRIINIGSIAPVLCIEGEAVYAASKSALTTFSQVFAREIAPLGITCNVVASTPILTGLIEAVPHEKIDEIVARLAIKRLGTFEDVINVVEFLADPKSDYVTGQVINLGGV